MKQRLLRGLVVGVFLLGWVCVSQLCGVTTAHAFISGTLFTDAGVTAAPAGVTIGIAVGTTTTSVYTVTTTAGGVWSLTGVATSSLASTTPITVWLDASTTDATTMVMGYVGSNITGVPVYYNRVVSRGVGTGSQVQSARFGFYDSDNDSDILLVTATSATSTILLGDFINNQGTFVALPANQTLIFTGSYQNNGTFNNNFGTQRFTGSSKTLSGTLTGTSILGRVVIAGSYTASVGASTTDLLIQSGGTFTAPSTRLTVTRQFSNAGTFTNNAGELYMDGLRGNIARFLAGTDVSGSATGNLTLGINAFAVSGNTLYVGKAGGLTACSQVAGSAGARDCELMVFDITSSTNPVYVRGIDSAGAIGGITGVSINALVVSGNTLYAGLAGTGAVACSQTASTTGASNCEIQVYDISSSTNPVYVAGRDSSGGAASTTAISVNTLAVSGNTLYVGLAGGTTACSQTEGTIGASNCELQVYDIASSTNPFYVAGRDSDGTASGILVFAVNKLVVNDNTLYIGKAGNTTACSNSTGTGAAHCEIQIYSIASTTNPVYAAGRDASGAVAGAGVANVVVTDITIAGNRLYVGKAGSATACSQTAGSADGCELMVYDISSSTGPVYLAGRDTSASDVGIVSLAADTVVVSGDLLYMSKVGNATACSQVPGMAAGCELVVFDISSTSNPIYAAGVDANGSATTSASVAINSLLVVGNTVYLAKAGDATACSQIVGGALGCELMLIENTGSAYGALTGTLTGASALNSLVVAGSVTMTDNASTTNVTVLANATTTPPRVLSVSGNYTNNGVTSFLPSKSQVIFTGASAQSLTGNLSATSALPSVLFTGAGTKTINNTLTVTGDFSNQSTFNANNQSLEIRAQIIEYVTSRDGGGSVGGTGNAQLNAFAASGTILYVGKASDAGVCSNTTGTGCELMVFDISSTTNPVYVAGRDGSGIEGTGPGGGVSVQALALSSNASGTVLYVGKAGGATACSQVAGSAGARDCELMVFDVSSSTNPIYAAGRDSAGQSGSSTAIAINTLVVASSTLYVGLAGGVTACSQTVGTIGASNCELQVYDIASSTNPFYVGGRDSDGTTTGILQFAINKLEVASNTLYVGKAGNTTTCSNSTGTGAAHCEIQMYSLASSTNPIYTSGRDASGAAAGAGAANVAVNDITIAGNRLYVGKAGNATACSQAVGGATGCELMVYDISSSTDPVYLAGRDADGSLLGLMSVAADTLLVSANNLYMSKAGSATQCSAVIGLGSGCELMVFDISSTSNPIYTAGRDINGFDNGTTTQTVNGIALSSAGTLYVGKVNVATACSQAVGAVSGCELLAFRVASNLGGTLTGASSLGTTTVIGRTNFTNNASTTNLTISASSTVGAPAVLSVSNTFNNVGGTFVANNGQVVFDGVGNQSVLSTATTTFHSLLKTATASSSLTFTASSTYVFTGNLALAGSGTTTRLSLLSSVPGVPWRLLPQGSTSVQFLSVRDSNNASTTAIICSVGCVDRGNNTNWNISFVITDAWLSGVLFTDTGSTIAPAGIPLKIAVATSTISIYDTTTATSGQWFINPVTAAVTSATPIVVWLDASTTDATTLVMGHTGGSVSGVSLYYNDVVSYGVTATSSILLNSFYRYDRDDDADILFTNNGNVVTIHEDIIHQQGTLVASPQTTRLAGSYTNNAIFEDNGGTLYLTGASKALAGTFTGTSSLGAVRVTGSYTSPANASTTSLVIENGGSFTAPSNNLSVTNTLSNLGAFTNNSGTVIADGLKGEIMRFLGGGESGVTSAGNAIFSLTTTGSTLYVGRIASAGTCVTTTGQFCELLIYDISSTTNPILLGGRESGVGSAGGLITYLTTTGSTLYVGRDTYTGTCTTTTGEFCELLVYDISSTTNPIFQTGRESGVGSGGGNVNTLTIVGSTLYMGGALYSGTCTTTTGEFCELLIYDISSTTNPVLLGGRESGVGSGGSNVNTLTIVDSTLYVGRNLYSGTCTTTTGNGCEVFMYDISSTTNPVLLGGRESGVGSLGSTVTSLTIVGSTLYVGRIFYTGTCTTTTGEFCELLIYDISSTTNPVLLGGRESGVGLAGDTIYSPTVLGSTLYVGRVAYTGACVTSTGNGCELLVYDISSTTNPIFQTGRESGMGSVGSNIWSQTVVGSTLYVGRDPYGGTCVNTTGEFCELLVYDTGLPVGLKGTFVGSSALNNLSLDGSVVINAVASTSNVTISSTATTTASSSLSVSGNFTNNGVLQFPAGAQLSFIGASQTLTGNLSGSSALPDVLLGGSGTKTFASNASTSDLTINSGVTMTAPTKLSVSGTYNNLGTAAHTGEVIIDAEHSLRYLGGQDVGAQSAASVVVRGNLLYLGRVGTTTTCSTSDRTGCELQVYDISGSGNPTYIGGQDSTTGAGADTFQDVVLNGSTLYVGKAGNSGTCSILDRTGCELQVYDISSTTNPVYVGGQDSTTGAGVDPIYAFAVVRQTLYAVKLGNTGTCSAVNRTGCELQVYDISSTTNPVYVSGQDIIGANNALSLAVTGTTLYVGKTGNAGTCSILDRTGCELQVYDISSTTNPVYVGGQDSTTGAGGDNVNVITVVNNTLYVGKSGNAGTCSGSDRTGCEIQIFNISSTTNPVYVTGLNAEGGTALSISNLLSNATSTALYVTRDSTGGTCSILDRTGCELQVYDISSTTNPVYVEGQDSTNGGSINVNDLALSPGGSKLLVAKSQQGSTCTTTARSGCELMSFEVGPQFLGAMTAGSAFNDVLVRRGTINFAANASTSNLSVLASTTLVAPSRLSVSGNYSNLGGFVAGTGTTTLGGVSQQNVTGILTGGNAFNHLEIANTSGNGSTTQAVVFGAPLETDGTFTMRASTSARFPANSTSTFASVNWDGGSFATPVYMRSSVTNTRWNFVTETAYESIGYVNVRDSNNASSTPVPCGTGCTNAGNNLNWSFPVPGSLLLGESTSTQATNVFSFDNQTDAPFYRFKLTPTTEGVTIDQLVLSLAGVKGIDATKVTNIKLHRDTNSNGILDGADVQVMGTGTLAVTDQVGTITFSSSTIATTTRDYLVTVSTVAIRTNEYLTVRLLPANITGIGMNALLPVTATGTVSGVQHIRGGSSGGGGYSLSPVGGDAPSGAGVQTGGSDNGGGEAGQGSDGGNIASDPDFRAPTTNGQFFNEWTNGGNAYVSDGVYATAATVGLRQTYGGFGFVIPEGNVIRGISVKVDASASTASGTLEVGLSQDGGVTITPKPATPVLSGSDVVYLFGGDTDLWFRSWTSTTLNDTNFRVRIIAQPGGNTVRLDALEVRVYHTAGGGGSGGGGEI